MELQLRMETCESSEELIAWCQRIGPTLPVLDLSGLTNVRVSTDIQFANGARQVPPDIQVNVQFVKDRHNMNVTLYHFSNVL